MESSHVVGVDGTDFPEFPGHEQAYIAHLSSKKSSQPNGTLTIADKIEKAREQIKSSLDSAQRSRVADFSRIEELEKVVKDLIGRMSVIESQLAKLKDIPNVTEVKEPSKKEEAKSTDEVDLFGSDDEEDENWEKIKAERTKAPKTHSEEQAKSSIVLDVKPWDDEVDMKNLEKLVREIKADGLLWGQAKLVPVAYGIQKLQICCVVEDDKVGTDFLEESIMALEDYVQSVDIAAFNKI